MQAGTCAHEVEELAFVATGGRTQGHPAGTIRLTGGKHRCCFALPGGWGLVLMNHRTARYRVAGLLAIDFPGCALPGLTGHDRSGIGVYPPG